MIAENPEVYGTPGGLARPEAETIFLPCTSGLPGTSPAGDSGQPGEAGELAAWAAGLGLEAGDLDNLVHDAYSRQASETNNDGLGARSGPHRVLRHGARPVVAQRPPAAEGRAARRRRRRGAGPTAGSARVAPAALPAGRAPGAPPARRAGPACFHAGGRVKPTTGDSPPLESGSP